MPRDMLTAIDLTGDKYIEYRHYLSHHETPVKGSTLCRSTTSHSGIPIGNLKKKKES